VTTPATTPAAKAVEAPKTQPAAKPANVVTKPVDAKDAKKVDPKAAAGPATDAKPGIPPKADAGTGAGTGANGKGDTTKTTEKPAETKKQ
jgi:hypothetical protein